MRAVVNTEYGGPDVLQIVDVERPAPADDEVLPLGKVGDATYYVETERKTGHVVLVVRAKQ